jgi:hypothetical protein
LFGPNFYINYPDRQNIPENILRTGQTRTMNSMTGGNRNGILDMLSRLFNNADVNVSPGSSNGNVDLSDLIFFVDDEVNQNTGLTLNEMNEHTTIEMFVPQEEEVVCGICQNCINENTIIRRMNVCSHRFHISCIDQWLNNNNSCPICRAVITTPSNETTNATFPIPSTPTANASTQSPQTSDWTTSDWTFNIPLQTAFRTVANSINESLQNDMSGLTTNTRRVSSPARLREPGNVNVPMRLNLQQSPFLIRFPTRQDNSATEDENASPTTNNTSNIE